MKILKKEKKLCISCMNEHEVLAIELEEKSTFKDVLVTYPAVYEYCPETDECWENEEMMTSNDLTLKNAYRREKGLLTTEQIVKIRDKYSITQTDLCIVLNWGEKTITRYEGHQVQDSAHDNILRKIDEDPNWFLELLKRSKDRLSESSYEKYLKVASEIFETKNDEYLKTSIIGSYIEYEPPSIYNGQTNLNLNKVVDTIRFFANFPKMKYLYKVKLMKLLWYADVLSYKNNGKAITGLVYRAKAMGALPLAHDKIICLNGVNFTEEYFNEDMAYHFIPDNNENYPSLSGEEIDLLNKVAERFCDSNKNEIVTIMHKEDAYSKTIFGDLISFEHSKSLSMTN